MTPRLAAALGPALAAPAAAAAVLALGAPWWAALPAAAAAAGGAGWAAGAGGEPASGRSNRDHPRAAARAPESRPDLPTLLDALPLGVLVIGSDGAIRAANRAAVETFGLPQLPLPAGMLRARPLLQAIEAGRRGETRAVDFPLPRGRDLHLRAHVRPVAGGAVVVSVEDRAEARRAGELHRDFVANASHELKTPLAVVSASIETLMGHAREDPAAAERFLGLMSAQVRRMTRLVEDLLSLNRIELNERVAPREPQELGAVVAEAVEALRPAAEDAGARLEFEPPSAPIQVRGERNELGQVFRNLVENAVKYGGPGVEVRVSLVSGGPEAPATVGVSVHDTGPGIAREHLPRLTERFYRVSIRNSRDKGGTGLGLAIVKHVVARHRGRLEIESRPGEGSCFTVWLPLREDEAEAERPAG